MSEYLKNAKVIWQGSTKPVEFSYIDFGGNKTRRKVDVTHVLYDPDTEVLYLQGHCHLKNAVRHFRVDNIETMLLIGSKRMYVEEWLSDLGIDDPLDCLEQQNLGNTQNRSQDPKVFSEGASLFNSISSEQSIRKVSPSLGLGIVFFPVIFAWFTLRRGHSSLSRILSFLWLAVICINVISGGNDDLKRNELVATSSEKTVTETVANNAFIDLSDCQLARLIVKDYMPLMMSLGQLIESKPTYQQTNEWKINSNFDAKIRQIESKYPQHYSVDFVNSRLAAGLNVRLDQLWREVFFSLRSTDNNGPIKSDQWSMVESELNQIMTSCKAEFDK